MASLELIEQGDTIKTVSSHAQAGEFELRRDSSAKQGTWYVLQARGKRPNVIALSAPICVWVDGEGFWKRSEVPSIVERMKLTMQGIFEPSSEHDELARRWIDLALR